QLRGRVGRGRARGIAYLLTDPAAKVAAATRKRLETLVALDRLGAGFALSARDLDLRGAGDLFGEDQAGHAKLVGLDLYRHLLSRAVRVARGEAVPEEWTPQVNAGEGAIPAAYVPEPELRLNLYARLARLAGDEVEALRDELEDRFGPLPEEAARLLALADLRRRCRELSIARLDSGPRGVAVTFRDGPPAGIEPPASDALAWKGERLVLAREDDDLLAGAAAMLDLLEG
ncbi:MAG TPA: TRCF domain-containing protein, partial [Beijerinckiaceae bacterium]|nr:TRCF domain-containing protein [Beijerinckiaceae bacterium]